MIVRGFIAQVCCPQRCFILSPQHLSTKLSMPSRISLRVSLRMEKMECPCEYCGFPRGINGMRPRCTCGAAYCDELCQSRHWSCHRASCRERHLRGFASLSAVRGAGGIAVRGPARGLRLSSCHDLRGTPGAVEHCAPAPNRLFALQAHGRSADSMASGGRVWLTQNAKRSAVLHT